MRPFSSDPRTQLSISLQNHLLSTTLRNHSNVAVTIVMVTATNPLLSNRTVSLLWKCRNSLLCNRHCYVTMEMQQTHYYTTGTATLPWKCNMVHRSCYQGKPNMSQYVFRCLVFKIYVTVKWRKLSNGQR
jgi:hypothetical protein